MNRMFTWKRCDNLSTSPCNTHHCPYLPRPEDANTEDHGVLHHLNHTVVPQKIENPSGWHGTRLSVTIQGAWASHRMYVLRYLRQIAVITPYAQISFDFKALDSKHDLSMMFRRRTTSMPEPPQHVRFLSLTCTGQCSYEKICCACKRPRALCELYTTFLLLVYIVRVPMVQNVPSWQVLEECAGEAPPKLS